MKILVFLFSLHTGFCLVCYSTNLVGLRSGQFRTNLQNCETNFKSLLIMQGMGKATLQITQNLNYSCYKIVTPSGSKRTSIRGCVPRGGCNLAKNAVNHMNENNYRLGNYDDFNCFECYEDRCNVGVAKQSFGCVILIVTLLVSVF
ncbi:uncharacterized protein LOC123003814 isoform X2 [Tribolium madens]|uniref:uncharacterized protein LOC123003814 isoform X2 n=1 Tax=Tribolium madens TaxID=41895 RepID=UPI001CF73F87|nr:uncharacterized protein LOC123003814 isoform X2 [Tribolium madens]